jgi:type IV fimbrial biogenesis protein FimT
MASIMPQGRFTSGYTLIELAATLAVGAACLAWAAPHLADWRKEAAMRAAVNRFAQTVFVARSEAIKRNETISICPSRDGERCGSSADWSEGWITFVNLDADSPAVRDEGEPLLRFSEALAGGSVAANRATLSFRAFGQPAATATVTFCDARGSSTGRAVIISQTGRPRIDHRNASGGSVSC